MLADKLKGKIPIFKLKTMDKPKEKVTRPFDQEDLIPTSF